MKGNDMKKEKKFNASYLLCLVPISSILIFLGLMIIPDKFIYLGSIPIWVPIAQQGLSGISVISVLIVIAAVLIWGWCGAIAARKRGKLLVSTLVAHAIPIISMVLYIIYKLIAAFGGGNFYSKTADIFATGFGLFNIAGSFIFGIVNANAAEIVFEAVLMFGTFVIGYSIGATGKKKSK